MPVFSHAKVHSIGAGVGTWIPKTEIFAEFWNINILQGHSHLRFAKFSRFVGSSSLG